MRHRLRRFAAVGALVTAVDLAVLLVLRLGLGVPVLLADAVSVTIAAVVSYRLHRAVTFADDPYRRWADHTRTFVWATVLAGVVDVVVLRIAVVAFGSTTVASLVVAKAVALAAAALVRAQLHRARLFHEVRAQQASRPDRAPAPGSMRLSVVIPAYREAGAIAVTLARLRAALAGVDGGVELVVVDDGSGDDTAAAARAAGADVVVELPVNRGKGAAVRAGVLTAHGRTVAFTDADLSYPPEQLVRLLAEVEAGYDVVVGSRKHVDTTTLVRGRRLRELSGRLFNVLTDIVLLGQYRDTQCGMKGFRSDVARLIFARTRVDRFGFDVEVFHLAERWRLSLVEVPVTLANRDASTVRVGADAVQMVRDLFRIRRWAGQGAYDLTPDEQAQLAGSGAADRTR